MLKKGIYGVLNPKYRFRETRINPIVELICAITPYSGIIAISYSKATNDL